MKVPGSAKGTELLRFTFGFALIHENTLGYFRIQDHLRKTGLGSRALAALLGHDCASGVTTVEPFAVPSSAPEIPRAEDIQRVKEQFRVYR